MYPQRNNGSKDPTITLKRAVKIIERIAYTTSVILVLGTVSYLSIHSWT